ncbi:MAG: sensor domain-containing diguanylate cyclase [Wenzhouxiangella sp.]|nr:MAG: sensor domain-containing diguanylate cyclase [Wenzhouxiangella sp.]
MDSNLIHPVWLLLVIALLLVMLVVQRMRQQRLSRLLAQAERRGKRRADSDRDSREAILAALAQASRLLFNNSDKIVAMERALAELGEAVGADRVYVFENHRDAASGRLLASQRHEWVAAGVEPQIDNPAMQGMDYEEVIPTFRRQLERGQAVHGRIEEMPEPERALLEPQNIRSIVVVPIIMDGEFWGQIGFDDCTHGRRWTDAEINALGIAAATIGAAIRGIRAEQELATLANTDSLTGLSSRRLFLKKAKAAHRRALDQSASVALLVMDLDHFKLVNDNHGHPVGDEALRWFAQACRDSLRDEDLIGRMGGEEFAVLLQDVDHSAAVDVAEKLRQRLESAPLQTAESEIRLTVSIGVAVLHRTESDFMGLLKRADQALYRAKNGGRNRVESASAPVNGAV